MKLHQPSNYYNHTITWSIILFDQPVSGWSFLQTIAASSILVPCQKDHPMRSSRRTMGTFAETTVVEYSAGVAALRCVFATFLADSSSTLDLPNFYLLQSIGWKSLCLLTGLSVMDYSTLLIECKLLQIRKNKDSSRSVVVDREHGMPFYWGMVWEEIFMVGVALPNCLTDA